MSNNNFTSNPRVHAIFDDLDKYLGFCKEFGYPYDEADLYSNKSYAYKQFQKHTSNKFTKNNWEIDHVKFKEQALNKKR